MPRLARAGRILRSLSPVFTLALASVLFPFPEDPEPTPNFQPMLGTVKSTDAEAGTFTAKVKSRTSTVKLGEKCALRLFERTTLEDVDSGVSVYILGLKKEVNWGSGVTIEIPKVRAIVVAKEFTPPPVPAKLEKEGFAWHPGKLTFEKAQNKYFIEQQTWVHANPKTVAYVAGKLERAKLFDHVKKKRVVWLQARTVDKKNVEAKQLIAFAGRVPAAEVALIVDVGGKKKRARR